MKIDDLAKEFEKLPKTSGVPATLFQGGQTVATGEVFLESDHCSFRPKDLSCIHISLRQPITLKRLDTGDVLNPKNFRWHECGTHALFEILPKP
jgi:hypothetical protein